MKTEFSRNWNASKQPRKQRKYRANATTNLKRKMLGAHLSKDLRSKYKMRSATLRKGDEVEVMRGKFDGKTGKVGKIDLNNLRVQVDGINREKRTGEKIVTWFDPSKLKIISLDTSDSRRFKKKEMKTEDKKGETKTEIKENKMETKENAHKKK